MSIVLGVAGVEVGSGIHGFMVGTLATLSKLSFVPSPLVGLQVPTVPQ